MNRMEIVEIIKDIDISILGLDYIEEFINDTLQEYLGSNDYEEVNKALAKKPFTYVTTGETYHTAEEMVYGIIKQTIDVVTEANEECNLPDEYFENIREIEKRAMQGDETAKFELAMLDMM